MRVQIKDIVHHDGKEYGPGAELDLDDAAAAALIAVGAAEQLPAEGKPKAKG